MSSNKFDALGSDDSEGEGDPGQTLVEVDWLKNFPKLTFAVQAWEGSVHTFTHPRGRA